MWSNMWSTPIFNQLPARDKSLSALAAQGFPSFPRSAARTWASRSQIKRDSSLTPPGYLTFPRMGQGLLAHTVTHIILTLISTFSKGSGHIPNHLLRKKTNRLRTRCCHLSQTRFSTLCLLPPHYLRRKQIYYITSCSLLQTLIPEIVMAIRNQNAHITRG